MLTTVSSAGSHLEQTRVGVIDAQPLFRDALCRVIRQCPQLQLAADAGDARQALTLIRDARPDVAVVDPALPALSGEHAVVGEIRVRAHDRRPLLSPREHEVLRRIANGQSAPAIGKAMHLSAATVKTDLGRLYDKLEVSERAAAVATAMRRGLID